MSGSGPTYRNSTATAIVSTANASTNPPTVRTFARPSTNTQVGEHDEERQQRASTRTCCPSGIRPAAAPATDDRKEVGRRARGSWPPPRRSRPAGAGRRGGGRPRASPSRYAKKATLNASVDSSAHVPVLTRPTLPLRRSPRARRTSLRELLLELAPALEGEPTDLQHRARARPASAVTHSLRRDVYRAGSSPRRMRIAARSTIHRPRSRLTVRTVYWRSSGNATVSPSAELHRSGPLRAPRSRTAASPSCRGRRCPGRARRAGRPRTPPRS